jgi:hypothetical protein
VVSENHSEDISSEFIVATTGGNGVRGDVEMAIPWRLLYGDDYVSRMYNTTGVKLSLAVVGHDNETALDTIPDVGSVNKNTNFTDTVVIDYFFNTGKIFTPPPLRIVNLTYFFTDTGLGVSWRTSRNSTSTLTVESGGVFRNYTLQGTEFSVVVEGLNSTMSANITVVAEDVYGNRAVKTVSYLPERENVTLEEEEKINPLYVAIPLSLGIIAVGEIFVRRRVK